MVLIKLILRSQVNLERDYTRHNNMESSTNSLLHSWLPTQLLVNAK